MSLPTLTTHDITAPRFVEDHAEELGDCVVVFDNGAKVTMPKRLAMINGIFWEIFDKFEVEIKPENIFWIDTITDETTNDISSEIYCDFVLKRRFEYLHVLGAVWCAINRTLKFVHRNCREYAVSLDALTLDRLCMQPAMKEVCTRPIDTKDGTRSAEKQHSKITADLYKLLGTPGALAYNPLKPYMDTKLLKRNQLPQMFCSYGPRSDIDDRMMKYVIQSNAFSGLKDIYDYATEYLSAKKAQFFNTDVIRKAQYFARRMRLGASRIHKVYPGWCGSTVTLPYTIDPKFKLNFLGIYIKVTKEEYAKYNTPEMIHMFDDCSIELTKDNIDDFVGREIQMWSPFCCRHTDGVCEHCAGYMNQHMIAFIPPDIQIGVFCATHLSSVITQKILSAKHLIKTSSKEFVLNRMALKYLSKNSDALLWQAANIGLLKKSYLRVSVADIGPISDLLNHPLPSGEAWSTIDSFKLVGQSGNVIEEVYLTDDTTHPYFSNYAMTYMKQHFKDIKSDNAEFIDIPLKDFDFGKPIFMYTAVNDDMLTYVLGTDRFLCSKICDYRSIGKCLQDFSTLVYSKSDINIFYIEMMLRAFLITVGGKDHTIPVITDPYAPVEFDKMSSMISESALSTKLSFERLEELFERPEPTMFDRGNYYGFNDALLGMSKDMG